MELDMATAEPKLVTDWVAEFQPAVRPDYQVGRAPAWYVARFVWAKSPTLFRLLRFVGQNYRLFEYVQKQPREKPITRSWFPGYVFLEIDLAHDHWQQIYSMPGFLEILGHPSALPDGMIEALDTQLMRKLAGRDPGVQFNPGDSVIICNGPFKDHPAIISGHRKGVVDVVAMIFGRPCKASLNVADVRAA